MFVAAKEKIEVMANKSHDRADACGVDSDLGKKWQ